MHHFDVSIRCLFILFWFSLLFLFFTVLDLNLPLDEFGAVDFDFVQNLAGNYFFCHNHILLLDHAHDATP